MSRAHLTDRRPHTAATQNWGAGEPTSSLPNLSNVLFDSHIYLKYRNLPTTRAGYLAEACKGLTAQEDSPVIVGEWSLSPAGDNEHAELSTQSEGAAEFYQQYFGALVQGFEQQGKGWICELRAPLHQRRAC